MARDLYAWLKQNGYQTSMHRPSCDEFVVDNEDLPIEVEIQNTEACKRYACVSITDCEVKESPKWLQDKLNIIGLRPINNIVDITNYIMMAYGQPLHCFDADMVTGHKIVVRTQPEGTKFVTLDGEEHTLGEHDLSICNAEEPMCIAGIFGGKGSGTYDTTKNVVLENAYFHPTWIRKSARRHGLSTDASYRFERGVDPNGQIYALKQAAILCKQLAGGKISMQIKDVYPEPIQDFPVRLNYEYAHRLIGKEIGAETIKNIATSLEMKIVKEDAEGLDLLVPAFRVDVQRPCDVVEDILRIYAAGRRGFHGDTEQLAHQGKLLYRLRAQRISRRAHREGDEPSECRLGSDAPDYALRWTGECVAQHQPQEPKPEVLRGGQHLFI